MRKAFLRYPKGIAVSCQDFMNKYYNRKTEVDGITFDSKAESIRYSELKLMNKAGYITDLVLQPKFILQEGFKKNGLTYRPIYYRADFQYFDKSLKQIIIEDVKGQETKEFLIKKKLFEKRYADLSLSLVR